MNYTSDEECIKCILRGNGRAFSELVDRHKNMVFSIVIRIVENQEDAEEIAQDVFLKVFQMLGTFKGSSKFSTWLYRIAYNAAVSHTRKLKPNFIALHENVSEHTEYSVSAFNLEEFEMDAQRSEALLKAVNRLKQNEILLINMYYTEQMSMEQISEITRLSVSNVKVKLFRIRKKLSEDIGIQ